MINGSIWNNKKADGMVLLGSLISRLTGRWFISAFLGVLQAFFLIILCWNWFGKSRLFLISPAVGRVFQPLIITTLPVSV